MIKKDINRFVLNKNSIVVNTNTNNTNNTNTEITNNINKLLDISKTIGAGKFCKVYHSFIKHNKKIKEEKLFSKMNITNNTNSTENNTKEFSLDNSIKYFIEKVMNNSEVSAYIASKKVKVNKTNNTNTYYSQDKVLSEEEYIKMSKI